MKSTITESSGTREGFLRYLNRVRYVLGGTCADPSRLPASAAVEEDPEGARLPPPSTAGVPGPALSDSGAPPLSSSPPWAPPVAGPGEARALPLSESTSGVPLAFTTLSSKSLQAVSECGITI